MNATKNPRLPSVLTIAGSDSAGGAGIQIDLKTFAAFGLHGVSAVTAVTAQNSRGVTSVHAVPASQLRYQMQSLFADYDIRAVKIGMLATAANVDAVIEQLQSCKPRHVVLDPVLASSAGTALLSQRGITRLRRSLLPLVHVLTPNIPEAGALLQREIRGSDAMRKAAIALRDMGPRAVLLKGGHGRGGTIVDHLADATGLYTYRHPRQPFDVHGTGCALSAAIAAALARGESLRRAVRSADRFLQRAIRTSYRSGKSAVRTLGIL